MTISLNLEHQNPTKHQENNRKFDAEARWGRIRAQPRSFSIRKIRRRQLWLARRQENLRLVQLWLRLHGFVLGKKVEPIAIDGVVEDGADTMDGDGGGGVDVRLDNLRLVDGEVKPGVVGDDD